MLRQSQIDTLNDLRRSAVRWIASHGLGLPEAEDIFQQAILKAIASPSAAEEPEKVTAWFYRVLSNTMIDELRREKSASRTSDAYANEILPRLDAETEEKLCQCVNGLFSDLAPGERLVLEKHFFDGKKFSELARESGEPEGSIRIRAHRARQKLRESLRACCNLTSFEQAKECECAPAGRAGRPGEGA